MVGIGKIIIHKIISELMMQVGGVPTPSDGFYDKGNPDQGPWVNPGVKAELWGLYSHPPQSKHRKHEAL